MSVVPNSRNSRQMKQLLATCGSPKVSVPDVCSVSGAQAEQGGLRALLSAIHIKQCKEKMWVFGKLLKAVLPALADEGRDVDGRFSQEHFFFFHSAHMETEKKISH